MSKTIWNARILSQAIGIIGKSGKILEAQVQAAAIQCIAQSIVHRNATPAQQLFEALPKGQRHDALVAYFEKFGNLAYSKAEKKVVFFDVEKITDKSLVWTDTYADEVAAFHWTKGTKKPEPKSAWDVSEELGKLIERMTKLASDSTKDVKHKDLLAKVTEVVNAYNFHEVCVETKVELTDDDKAALAEELEANMDAQAILDAISTGNMVEVVEVEDAGEVVA